MQDSSVSKTDLLPLYIGITGHRNIRDEDKLRLKQILIHAIDEKIAQCPDTPVIILTPLAEGADRLAAYAAIECGIPYIAALPMPVEEYRKDFITPESLHEFNDLLGKADLWFELPLSEGTREEELQYNKEKRDDQYYNIGFYIARQSQMLIALWDGNDNKKRGGTAHIVNIKRTGLPAAEPHIRQRLKNLQTGPVYHILTPRKGSPLPANAYSVRIIYTDYRDQDDSGSMEEDRQVLANIDSYNRDMKMLIPKFKEKIERSETGLLVADELIQENLELRRIARCHAITDTLASHFQAKRFFALKVLLVLAVVAFMFFQIYVEFWHKSAVLLLYPITMGIGALWFMQANRKRFEQKHEDYRALSEAFRVQYFITIAEKNARVSEFYLHKHKGELEWVIYALRASLLNIPALNNHHASRTNENKLGKYNYINQHWVTDQLAYYKKTSQKYTIQLERLRGIANLFFFGAMSAAIILFLLSTFAAYLPSFWERHMKLFHSILVVCTHSFLVISAAVLGYNEKMIFAEQSKVFHQMYQLFKMTREKLTRAIESNNPGEAGEIVWDLAQESLMENADWLILHRSRPLELPKG
jgi:hypothetical protein